MRTLPYLRAWYARYHADGFTIVGVQTPEFVENAVFGSHDLRLSPEGYGLAIYDVDFESCEVPGTH